ncbi:hypothetical protein HHK36_000830 [Tetracentron sinense]|uniref:Zinc finger MYM-type protein 1-like n=1 Tax=Tetracentron sinense TaxID=13715 RepID=A0A835DQC8_TETSI|nr:hypothetical protein HHK36_000830 [Tetracentron sinense]
MCTCIRRIQSICNIEDDETQTDLLPRADENQRICTEEAGKRCKTSILVREEDTMALTLKKSICAIFSHHGLSIQNIRGQGYDGANNMRSEWNGLQALFLKDCSFAYYIHCFAHRLQPALVAASKEVKNVYNVFTKLTIVDNTVSVSCKCHDELQVVQAEKIAHLLAINELESELNKRFNEHTMKLLVLSSTLDPGDSYKSFKIDDICKLVDKFYPQDFTEQEKIYLRYQLQHYEHDVPQHPELRNMLAISGLCQGLVKTGKSVIYPLVDRLIRLVLTLPVSTATTERAFSAMKILKTRLRNKMEDEYLADTLVVNIEKEIAEKFTTESIIEDFYSMKERRAQLQ